MSVLKFKLVFLAEQVGFSSTWWETQMAGFSVIMQGWMYRNVKCNFSVFDQRFIEQQVYPEVC